MPTTNEQQEIQKMTAIANNEEQKPEVRINAARRLLRKTNFSSRSVRVGKRIAKIYFTNEDVSSEVRAKAASLLEFVLSKPEDDGSPLESLAPAAPFTVEKRRWPTQQPKRSVHELNIGWDHPKQPKKFIEYCEPEELPQFGIPADPSFKQNLHDEIAEIATDSGVYYARIGSYVGLRNEPRKPDRVLNPKYVAAYEAWKLQRPREANAIFEEELDLMTRVVVVRSGYRVPRDMDCKNPCNAPCDMLFVPNVTYEIEESSNAKVKTTV